jgi:hypothetical protein
VNDRIYNSLNLKLEYEEGSLIPIQKVLNNITSSNWNTLSLPHALHFKAKVIDSNQIRFGSSTIDFEIGHTRGTFFWSVEQKSVANLAAAFQESRYKLVWWADNRYLVIEKDIDFFSRVGLAEIGTRLGVLEEMIIEICSVRLK